MRTKGTADDWYAEQELWSDEVAALRPIMLARGLGEAVKWGQPAYTDDGKNILLISVMKAGATVNFFKGALLEDAHGDLLSPGENTRHGRFMVFTSVEDVAARRDRLEALVGKAIEAERAGLKIEPLPDEIAYVEELQQRLDADEAFREAFEALTPGRRRAYNMHFEKGKRASTRESRITACTERILAGKGLMDCVCGHSKRPPRCDGTHKHYT